MLPGAYKFHVARKLQFPDQVDKEFCWSMYSAEHDVLLPQGRLKQGEDTGTVKRDVSILLCRPLRGPAPEEGSSGIGISPAFPQPGFAALPSKIHAMGQEGIMGLSKTCSW